MPAPALLVRGARVVPPRASSPHRLGCRYEAVGDGVELGFRIIQAENKSSRADPAQCQACLAQVILKHPIVSRRPGIEYQPNRREIRHLHGQSRIAQTLIEPRRPPIPGDVEITIQGAYGGALSPPP